MNDRAWVSLLLSASICCLGGCDEPDRAVEISTIKPPALRTEADLIANTNVAPAQRRDASKEDARGPATDARKATTPSVSGRVLDAMGAGLADVQIRATLPTHPTLVPLRTKTERDGHFRVLLPRRGRPLHIARQDVVTITATDKAGGTASRTTTAGNQQLTLRLPRPNELTVRVVDPDGRSVPRVRLRLHYDVGHALFLAPTGRQLDGQTARISLPVPRPNVYAVEAVGLGNNSHFAPGFSEPVRVGPGTRGGAVTVKLQRSCLLRGVVHCKSKPIPGARIRLYPKAAIAATDDNVPGLGTPMRGTAGETTTDSKGRFRFSRMIRGDYWVWCEPAALAPSKRVSVRLVPERTSSVTLAVTPRRKAARNQNASRRTSAETFLDRVRSTGAAGK